ncbi:MAG: Peptide/nickel transport system ATP-binding protein/energy-coupling factor transport system [Friedmanniella sp.]|nr:Peptide/nickel transport system ATP-binding protein/energy-coupling factor transport system [Friedmanniella sp.]
MSRPDRAGGTPAVRPPDPADMTPTVRRPDPAPAVPTVRLRDVFVAYPRPQGALMALRGLDLEIHPGERLVVQGPNGSGKSTLLRVITGEQPVAAGTVEVGGTALHRLRGADRRRWRAGAVGFLDQHARRNLFPQLDVTDNVALQLRLTGASSSDAHRRATAVLAELGLTGLAHRAVASLSGGEAQRVAIGAAVAHAPALLLADEPTGELDEDSAHAVYTLLGRVATAGTSLVLVSHDRRAEAYADRTVAIRDGRLAEQWWPGDGDVEQVPDASGWLRLPPDLLPRHRRTPLVARRAPDGVVLTVPARNRSEDVVAGAAAAPIPVVAPADHGLDTLLQLAGVRAAYGPRVLFAGLDLTLARGGWAAVTGPSGSGKTTLVGLLAGLLDPVEGQVRVGGVAWAALDREARALHRRDWLALGPQRPQLVEALTVRENLDLTAAVRGGQAVAGTRPSPAGERAATAEALPSTTDTRTATAEALGLLPLLDQAVATLSGGERQRVALARCLVTDAPLVVLDEPTSQQDEESAERVVQALLAACRAGRAVVVASHDARLTDAADRVLALGPPAG